MRQLKWWAFLLVVVVYLGIIQIGGLTIGNGIGHDETFETSSNLFRVAVIPIGLSAAFAVAVATWLRWWPAVIHERLRVRKWIWFIPITFLATSFVITDWANLFDQKVQLVAALLLMVGLVGFTEELMFRGIGVVTLRQEGLSEARVALFSSLIFGAVHLSNAIAAGADAILQATIVAFSGYFFYLSRRVSGVIWVPMVLHGLWDFSLITAQLGIDPSPYALGLLAIAVQVVFGVVLVIRRRKIEPLSAV